MSRRLRTRVAICAGALAALSIVVGIALVAGAYPFQVWGSNDPGIVVRLGAPVLRLAVDGFLLSPKQVRDIVIGGFKRSFFPVRPHSTP